FLAAAFADLSGCRVIALGSVTGDEYTDWLAFFASRGVTAIGGTPSVLRLWFAHARAAGVRLPALRKVLWLGEAWHSQLDEDSVVQVRGLGLHVDDIIAQVEREPGVSRAQIVITQRQERVSTVDVLLLTDRDAVPDLAERIRKDLMSATFTISTAFQHDPQSF